jgi:hypothetical protein
MVSGGWEPESVSTFISRIYNNANNRNTQYMRTFVVCASFGRATRMALKILKERQRLSTNHVKQAGMGQCKMLYEWWKLEENNGNGICQKAFLQHCRKAIERKLLD